MWNGSIWGNWHHYLNSCMPSAILCNEHVTTVSTYEHIMKISMTQQKTKCNKPIQQAQLSVNTLTSQSQKNKTCLFQFLCFFWHLTAYVHHHFYLTGVDQTAVNWSAVWSLDWLQFTDSLLLLSFTGARWPSLSLSSLQFLCLLLISSDGTFLNSLPSSWHRQWIQLISPHCLFISFSPSLSVCFSAAFLLLCSFLKFPVCLDLASDLQQFLSILFCFPSLQPSLLHLHFRSTVCSLYSFLSFFPFAHLHSFSFSRVILNITYYHIFPLSPLLSLCPPSFFLLTITLPTFASPSPLISLPNPFLPPPLISCWHQSPTSNPPKSETVPPLPPLCHRQNGHASVD